MVFGHKRGKGYPWDVILVLWDTSYCFALYDGYLGAIDGFYYADFVCGNCTVPDVIFLWLISGSVYTAILKVAVIFLLPLLL